MDAIMVSALVVLVTGWLSVASTVGLFEEPEWFWYVDWATKPFRLTDGIEHIYEISVELWKSRKV